jgi:hypothetical protein
MKANRERLENRERLIPIIDCVILCGRQEIALRGHKDYGKIDSILKIFIML